MTLHREGHKMLVILLVVLILINTAFFLVLPQFPTVDYIVLGFSILLFLSYN